MGQPHRTSLSVRPDPSKRVSVSPNANINRARPVSPDTFPNAVIRRFAPLSTKVSSCETGNVALAGVQGAILAK